MSIVHIALGSNINPEQNLIACAQKLRSHWPDIEFSPVYQTTAQLDTDQADFLNAVASMETDQSPEEIHQILKNIEDDLGKDPPHRYGPRTIDLDLLLYGNELIDSDALHVPHPRMHERRFVLQPLCTVIDPMSKHPMLQQTWSELLAASSDQHCTLVEVIKL